MAIKRKSPDQVIKMREAGKIVARALAEIREAVKPGVSTWELDQIAAKVMQQHYGTKTSSNNDIGFIRLRDPDDMLAELKDLMSKYDVKAFSFNDDTFTMNKDQTRPGKA